MDLHLLFKTFGGCSAPNMHSLQGILSTKDTCPGLLQGCEGDVIVAAAVRSIPRDAVSQGLPTPSQLEARFETIKQAAGELAYFPPGKRDVKSFF